MNQRMKKAAKGVALLLVFVVLQVYVQADLIGAGGAHAEPNAAADQAPTGRLTTRGNEPVTVNGTSARSGQTIFSGQQIQTPAGTSATVQLGPLGRVELAPGTSATITFDAAGIKVTLLSGCAILTANKGIAGTVETAVAEPQHTDAANGSSLNVCADKTQGAAPVTGQGTAAATAAGGLFGMGTASTVAFVAAVAALTGTAIFATHRPSCVPRGANPSPTVPRGPCR